MKEALKTIIKKTCTLEDMLKILRLREKMRNTFITPVQTMRLSKALKQVPEVQVKNRDGKTNVDEYWGEHTISSFPYFTARASLDYIKTIDDLYPLYFEYCELYAKKTGKVVLEYGCGPGNDLLGWLLYSDAKKVIAMDISRRALEQARRRIALHEEIDYSKVEFIQVSDTKAEIPLPDNSVDYINCLGVLHHTSNPDEILQEFKRVLKPGGEARLMLYHYDSIYLHLCVAYELQIQQGFCAGKTAVQAYDAMADGGAPIARLTTAEDFVEHATNLGFDARFLGAAYSITELNSWKRIGIQAMNDERLKPEHREFMKAITIDQRGYPMYKGREAGLDAIFSLKKK